MFGSLLALLSESLSLKYTAPDIHAEQTLFWFRV